MSESEWCIICHPYNLRLKPGRGYEALPDTVVVCAAHARFLESVMEAREPMGRSLTRW